MTSFELESLVISLLEDSPLFKFNSSFPLNPTLKGSIYKEGTRPSKEDEDVLIEVLSIDDKQWQSADVSVKIYSNDLNIGSPKPVPNISRMKLIAEVFQSFFSVKGSSYAVVNSSFMMKINFIKREKVEAFDQHYVNCLLEFTIRNF